MLIRLGYDIQFAIAQTVPIVAMLSVHPSRRHDLQGPDRVGVDQGIEAAEYMDAFGNICTRVVAQPGTLRLTNSVVIQDSGLLDPYAPDAREVPVEQLPPEVLRFLMASRFCEVDLLSPIAVELFGNAPRGWGRVAAICNWVNTKVTFSYPHARPTRTALDVFTERIGVCRDFQHLAVTFCR
ncbi:MAG TPA: transglutaminase family protein, partial [Vicinamibacterales bacterium]|nr:transglutaminase family protein [Vicinamibacterales bacterium]